MKEWHIIALLGITIIVYARVFLKEPKTGATENVTEQIEQSLEFFAAEIEEENKQVLNHVVKLKQHYDQETAELKARIHNMEQRLASAQLHEEKTEPIKPNPTRLKDENNETIKQRYEHIFALYDEGRSIEAISKKIGIPKGEVQLILKLAQQEEAYNG